MFQLMLLIIDTCFKHFGRGWSIRSSTFVNEFSILLVQVKRNQQNFVYYIYACTQVIQGLIKRLIWKTNIKYDK
jgi:hypothetical protein